MGFNSKLLLLGCCMILQQFAKQVEAAGGGEWDYGDHGPNTTAWCEVSGNICCGSMQSPINLNLTVAKFGMVDAFSFKDYDKPLTLNAINNGHSASFSQDPKSADKEGLKPSASGGGLTGTYTFHSFHFHWGDDDSKGSEHWDNGFQYAAEGHLVHYRSDFKNLGDAVASGQPDALAVLGVFYAVDGPSNDALKAVTDSLNSITSPKDTKNLSKKIKLMDLLPFNKVSIYRYMGSLTTPNCNEVVVWTVFTTPQYLNNKQITAFRKLLDENKKKLVNNFRPPKELGKRELYRLEAKSGSNNNV